MTQPDVTRPDEIRQHDSQQDQTPRVEPADGSLTTGHPRVDAVLQSLQPLSELPVDQHVAVFESAHAGLREALSDAGSQPLHG